MESILPLILILLILIVPSVLIQMRQRRKLEEFKTIQASLEVGEEVLTTAGMHARVHAVGAETVDLEVAPGVVSRFEKFAVVKSLSKPTAEA